MSEPTTGQAVPPCPHIIRVRNKADRFIATRLTRHAYGVEAQGQWRTGPNGHYYPDTPGSYVWPWREVVEIRELQGGWA